jgi:hypothetical protein
MVVSLNWESIGVATISVVIIALFKFGRRKGIAEARFDRETGKQIK